MPGNPRTCAPTPRPARLNSLVLGVRESALDRPPAPPPAPRKFQCSLACGRCPCSVQGPLAPRSGRARWHLAPVASPLPSLRKATWAVKAALGGHQKDWTQQGPSEGGGRDAWGPRREQTDSAGAGGSRGWEAGLGPGPRALGAGHPQRRLPSSVAKSRNVCYSGSGERREGPTKPHVSLSPEGICNDGVASPISQMRKLRPREGQEAASLSSRSPEWGEPADPAGEEGRGLAWVAEQGFHSENKPARPSQGPRKRPGQGRHSRGLKGSLGR